MMKKSFEDNKEEKKTLFEGIIAGFAALENERWQMNKKDELLHVNLWNVCDLTLFWIIIHFA